MSRLYHGNCLEVLPTLAENSVDTCLTDPPYGLSKEPDTVEVLTHWLNGDDYTHTGGGFMGKGWDSFVPGPAVWREVYRVLKPGGTLLCFASSRTFDLMGISLRLAGFELHPFFAWIFGSGFPKATSLSKMLDKDAGMEREIVGQNPNSRPNMVRVNANVLSPRVDAPITTPASEAAETWNGWYYGKQAVKPAMEPILMAVKPHEGRMVDSCQEWGVAGLWIDGARVETNQSEIIKDDGRRVNTTAHNGYQRPNRSMFDTDKPVNRSGPTAGRWPANVLHDGSPEVVAGFPVTTSNGGKGPHKIQATQNRNNNRVSYSDYGESLDQVYGDTGSAARFFYCAKASRSERTHGGTIDNRHPTVKPLALLQYLARLTRTPTGGVVLDPFMGSGSTGVACILEGREFIGIEMEAESFETARQRIEATEREPVQLRLEVGQT